MQSAQIETPTNLIDSGTVPEPVPSKYKAGVFIFGKMGYDGQKQMCTLAPWAEGNFSNDGRKAYLMPKGTVDEEDVDMKAAAIREVAEETGIFIDEIEEDPRPEEERRYIYDPGNEKHKRWKKEGLDKFYKGVEVKCWLKDGEPVFDGIIPTNRGNPAHHTMYAIQVKGIENLKDVIKYSDNGMRGESVKRKATAIAAEEINARRLPAFNQLLKTLRTGIWSFGPENIRGRLFAANFQETEKYFLLSKRQQQQQQELDELLGRGTYTQDELLDIVERAQEAFKRIDEGKEVIKSMDDLDELFQTTSIQDTVKDDLACIRKFMQGKGKHADVYEDAPLLSDTTGLKLDVKQHPLRYYQESADLIPCDVWVERMIRFADMAKLNGQDQPNELSQYQLSQFNRNIDDAAPMRHYRGQQRSIADAVLSTCRMVDPGKEAKWMDLEGDIERLSAEVDQVKAPELAARAMSA